MKIVIPGNPIPKARHRTIFRNGKATTFDPQSKEKEAVRQYFIKEIERAYSSENKRIVMDASDILYGSDFHLDVSFYLPICESSTKAHRNAKLWGIQPANAKPDLSNMLKFYEDAANRVLYDDDSKITSVYMHKQFSNNPRTEIIITAKEKMEDNPKAEKILEIFSPQELEEMVYDAVHFNKTYPDSLEEVQGLARHIRVFASASFIADFAEKYSDLLRKVKKLGTLQDSLEYQAVPL